MKDISKYQAIIVDLDGTLYYLQPVRMAMLKEMILNFWKIRDFLVVYKYRRLFELGFSENERFERLPYDAPSIIHEWMISRPCSHISRNRDKKLIHILKSAQTAGVCIIVYSDYPVKEKLSAMNFEANFAYRSEDIGEIKPDSAGLEQVLMDNKIDPKFCAVIGDREEKDGVLASRLGSDVIILPKNPVKREKMYAGAEV